MPETTVVDTHGEISRLRAHAISEAAWFTASFSFGGFMAVIWGVYALAPAIPPTALGFIYVLAGMSLICLLAAGREHYIREGIRIALSGSARMPIAESVSRAAEELPPSLSKPNIQYLEKRLTDLSFSEGSYIHGVRGDDAPKGGVGILAVFMNRPLTERPVGEADGVRANITYTCKGVPDVNVTVGWWFDRFPSRVKFAVADARELIIVLQSNDGKTYAVDGRKLGTQSSPLYINLNEPEYAVHVTLTLDGEIVCQFEFALKIKPSLLLQAHYRMHGSVSLGAVTIG
jgi:hypothetical protein